MSVPTFHYYIKVVDNLSSRVLAFTHVFPAIRLIYRRYEQQLSKVVQLCPKRQLVSHFHPFYCWSGTTTWNDMLWHAVAGAYDNTLLICTVTVLIQHAYILSLRNALKLQVLPLQQHLLRLNTRGQQQAGSSRWAGLSCDEHRAQSSSVKRGHFNQRLDKQH